MEAHDTPNTTADPLTAAVAQRTPMPTNALSLSLVALLLIVLILFGGFLLLRGHGGQTRLPATVLSRRTSTTAACSCSTPAPRRASTSATRRAAIRSRFTIPRHSRPGVWC